MKTVHRLDARAGFLLDRMARSEGLKPSVFLSRLVKDYAAGLTFGNDDPDLDSLPSPEGATQ